MVLLGALAWRLALFNPLEARGLYDAIEGIAYGVVVGLLPALALATFARRVRMRSTLIAAAVTSMAIDVVAIVLASSAATSTGSVIAMTAPLAVCGVVVPILLVASRLG